MVLKCLEVVMNINSHLLVHEVGSRQRAAISCCRMSSDFRLPCPGWRTRWWHPIPVLLPGKSHGFSLVGCSPRGRKQSDTTERLHFHFSLSCIGERNGNPLQCSCLENPKDGGAWRAAVYGVAQSQTWLKWLSSSSSSSPGWKHSHPHFMTLHLD